MSIPISMARMFTIASVAIAIESSCISSDNPRYCQGGCDAGTPDTPDALSGCTSNETCMAPTAVCELETGMCVHCTATDEAACIGTSPVCNADHACRACQAHSECASSACLSDGSCADEGSVAYVDAAGTSNAACSLATPCTQVASALATHRPYIKVTGTIDEGITIGGTQTVTFLGAPGGRLTRSDNGPLLQLQDAAQVVIYDLEISGAHGGYTGISLAASSTVSLTLVRTRILNNTGGGISAGSGALTVSRSTISSNTGRGIVMSGGTLAVSQSTVSSNDGGGILLSGAQFDLTNNIIVNNGSGSSVLGGVKIGNVSASAGPPHRLDFNTISANVSQATLNAGVTCGSDVVQSLAFSNNIIYGNVSNSSIAQIGGSSNCTTSYSDIGPGTVAGIGNLNSDPRFVNAAQGDYHIMTNSPAKDEADPSASLATDFDGDPRPYGPARDIGADEVTAP